MKNFPFFVMTVGRRKIAIANIKLLPGVGNIQVNGNIVVISFMSHHNILFVVQLSFIMSEHLNFNVQVNAIRGGLKSQGVSIQLSFSRALIINQPKNQNIFRIKNFLTRDPREKERRKYGLKKARKAPQFSKR